MRLAIASVLLFLTSASVAHADCAWVLWMEERLATTPAESSWRVLQATTTNESCQAGLYARVRDDDRYFVRLGRSGCATPSIPTSLSS